MVIFYYETINHTIVAPTIPTKPTIVSITVHVFRFVFSSTSNKDLESQKPESFTWLKAVPPAAIAIVSVASCNCERPETIGMCCNYFYISGALLDHGYTITIGFSAFNTYDVYIYFFCKTTKTGGDFSLFTACFLYIFCIFLLSFIKKRFYNVQYI